MLSASSWNTTLVVRPHPGHALTSGENERKPIVCRISCATIDFTRAVAVRLRCQRDADRVADTLLQQHGQRGRRRDDPFRAHARFGESEMQRVIAASGELRVDGDQVLHVRDLAREDDRVFRHADRFGELRAADCRGHERLADDVRRVERMGRAGVLIHQARQQLLVEAPPVDADAHGLAVVDRTLDHHGELRVAPRAGADVAGVDPVLGECLRTVGKIAEQLVSVVVEIADQRHVAAECVEPLADLRDGSRRFGGVDGNPHKLGAGVGKRFDLCDRGRHVGRVRVRHRLDDDRRAAADAYAAHQNGARAATDDRSFDG